VRLIFARTLVAGCAALVVAGHVAPVPAVDAALSQPRTLSLQESNRPTYDLVHSNDPDRPGVGVTTTEEVVVPGSGVPAETAGTGAPAPERRPPQGKL
jgi:hypothetical protein